MINVLSELDYEWKVKLNLFVIVINRLYSLDAKVKIIFSSPLVDQTW